ncbi:MAG: molybdopterin-guanine dinucleotide biosynthesis protein B, partial [Dehalococcoidia bacterium]
MSTPILCIVGKSGSGKTALLERLIPELKARGYRVACIKHTHHPFELDRPETDSSRLSQAGAEVVALLSDRGQALLGNVVEEGGLSGLAFLAGGRCDLVLTEGFRSSRYPKMEVHRPELGPDLLLGPDELVAVVSDAPVKGVDRRFSPGQVAELADYIEQAFLKRKEGEWQVELLVNGEDVFLNPFLRTILERVLLGV